MTAGWTIGHLAKAVGVNIQTVRYYERLKLLSPSVRRPSGYRVYGENEERRLRFIRNAQSLGFTLHEIEELLNLRVSFDWSLWRCAADSASQADASRGQGARPAGPGQSA